jgi:rubrerythrin
MTTTYTMTKRYNGEVVETNVPSYFAALALLDKYPDVDVIIHKSTETMREHQQRIAAEPYDITQGGWAWL